MCNNNKRDLSCVVRVAGYSIWHHSQLWREESERRWWSRPSESSKLRDRRLSFELIEPNSWTCPFPLEAFDVIYLSTIGNEEGKERKGKERGISSVYIARDGMQQGGSWQCNLFAIISSTCLLLEAPVRVRKPCSFFLFRVRVWVVWPRPTSYKTKKEEEDLALWIWHRD